MRGSWQWTGSIDFAAGELEIVSSFCVGFQENENKQKKGTSSDACRTLLLVGTLFTYLCREERCK